MSKVWRRIPCEECEFTCGSEDCISNECPYRSVEEPVVKEEE